MGIVIGLTTFVFVIVMVYAIGRTVGPPDPKTMTEDQLRKRWNTENDWLYKYNTHPQLWDKPKLQEMADAKNSYVALIKAELERRGLHP